jgi:hypothetical protein
MALAALGWTPNQCDEEHSDVDPQPQLYGVGQARGAGGNRVGGRLGVVIASSAMAKSPCPVSKTQFLEKAEPVKITIGTSEIIADKREFSTGSFGWYYNGKTTITVDGKPLSIQIGLNLTVVGSKEAER